MSNLQPLVTLTPVAKEKLVEVMETEKVSGSFLRIGVFQGGGCACSGGYRYALSLEEKAGTGDLVEDVGGLKVLVEKGDADVIRGSKIDFVESLQRTGFKIENPNVRSGSCGCGAH